MNSFGYYCHVDYSKIITIEPGKRSGKPTIRGTRMTVTDVLEYLAGGMTRSGNSVGLPRFDQRRYQSMFSVRCLLRGQTVARALDRV
jgi:hypothetical protein